MFIFTPCRLLVAKIMLAANVSLLVLLVSANQTHALGPVGWERHTLIAAESGVFFDKSFEEVYQNWSTPVPAPGLAPKPQHGKRLIDIEVRLDEKSNRPSVSGVWIANVGSYERKSWLMHGVKAVEIDLVIEYLKLAKMIIVDVERYQPKKGVVTDFAFLIQENVDNLDWELMTGFVTFYPEDIWREIGFKHRVLDLDWLGYRPVDNQGDGPLKQAAPSSYDIVTVQNSGDHAIFSWVERISHAKLSEAENDPYHKIVDIDQRTDTHVTAVFVYSPGFTFRYRHNLSTSEVNVLESKVGPVKDLEGGLKDHPSWYTVHMNLPN